MSRRFFLFLVRGFFVLSRAASVGTGGPGFELELGVPRPTFFVERGFSSWLDVRPVKAKAPPLKKRQGWGTPSAKASAQVNVPEYDPTTHEKLVCALLNAGPPVLPLGCLTIIQNCSLHAERKSVEIFVCDPQYARVEFR